MKFIGNRRRLSLEGELRANRPEARPEFVTALADDLRSQPMRRTRLGRVGLAFALSALIVVALASFGGVGYASSAATHAVKKPAAVQHVRVAKSAAAAQYAGTTLKKPAAKKQTPASTQQVQVAGAAKSATAAPKVKSGQLPFTGLALWIPLAGGVLLIAFGLVLRTRGRRPTSLG
jgi:hypothetical protein